MPTQEQRLYTVLAPEVGDKGEENILRRYAEQGPLLRVAV